MKKHSLKKALMVLCIFLMPVVAICQDDEDPTDDEWAVDPDAAVPIDGGVIWLVAAGVAYGIKKTADQRKKLVKGTKANLT